MVMVCAQLVVFGRISSKRQEMHERNAIARRKAAKLNGSSKEVMLPIVERDDKERPVSLTNGDLTKRHIGTLQKDEGMNGHVVCHQDDLEDDSEDWDMGS